MAARSLEIRGNLQSDYGDVYTKEALAALDALAPLDKDRQALMKARIERRNARARNKQRIAFLDPNATIGKYRTRVRETSKAARSRKTSSDSGFRAQVLQHDRTRLSKRAFATSHTRSFPAPTDGCSTAKTLWARSPRCLWTITAT
jgi:hypothetical protein